jgi:hypothetical protein
MTSEAMVECCTERSCTNNHHVISGPDKYNIPNGILGFDRDMLLCLVHSMFPKSFVKADTNVYDEENYCEISAVRMQQKKEEAISNIVDITSKVRNLAGISESSFNKFTSDNINTIYSLGRLQQCTKAAAKRIYQLVDTKTGSIHSIINAKGSFFAATESGIYVSNDCIN